MRKHLTLGGNQAFEKHQAFAKRLSFTKHLALALALGTSVLARTSTVQAADFRLNMEISEIHRTALINEPRRLKHIPRATIIVLHGIDNGARIRSRLGLDSVVAEHGIVTVYPDALNGRWNSGIADTSKPDDVAYLKALINKLVASGISNPHRIYLVGASDGGMMALRFTCEAGHLLAGTATLLANMPRKLAESCKPSRPAPIMTINGTEDPIVPYNGGALVARNGRMASSSEGEVISAEATLDIFAKRAGCSTEKQSKPFADKDKDDKSIAVLDSFTGCQAPVQMIRVVGGGHTIPGHRGPAFGPGSGTGATNHDIESNRVIWEFFRALPGN